MFSFARFRLLTLAVAALTYVGCTQSDGPPAAESGSAAAPTAQKPTLATIASLELRNAREPVAGLITSAQPDQEQFEALVAAGFENFISLRPTSEEGAGWEEARAANGDVGFTRIPISGAAGLTREAVDELDRLLREAGDDPTVLYCASSNRVGALLALRAHWIEGVEPEAAIEFGLSAGMTRLESAVAELLGVGGG